MKKVLILEDEEILGSIYKKKLVNEGFDVQWVKTIAEVKFQAQEYDADFVILDHGIKNDEGSGLDVIPTVRKFLPDVHIVMLSNYSQSQLQEKALREGANAYMIKMNTSPKALVHYLNSFN